MTKIPGSSLKRVEIEEGLEDYQIVEKIRPNWDNLCTREHIGAIDVLSRYFRSGFSFTLTNGNIHYGILNLRKLSSLEDLFRKDEHNGRNEIVNHDEGSNFQGNCYSVHFRSMIFENRNKFPQGHPIILNKLFQDFGSNFLKTSLRENGNRFHLGLRYESSEDKFDTFRDFLEEQKFIYSVQRAAEFKDIFSKTDEYDVKVIDQIYAKQF